MNAARIAKDIHDDLGSTLTHITMLSDPQRDARKEVARRRPTLSIKSTPSRAS